MIGEIDVSTRETCLRLKLAMLFARSSHSFDVKSLREETFLLILD
jgi:hypothetical protein